MARQRWHYSLFTVIALGLYLWGGVAQSDLATAPADLALEGLAYPVTVADAVAGSPEELELYLQTFHPGDLVTLAPAQGPSFSVVLPPAFSPLYPIVTMLNGLFFWFVSLLVFAPRIDKVPAHDLFWACILYGLAVMIGGVFFPRGGLWPNGVLPLARVVSLVLLPTLMLHAGMTFPRRVALLDRHPSFIRAVFAIGLVLAAWQGVTLARWWSDTRPELWQATVWPARLGKVYLATVFAGGIASFFHGNAYAERVEEKEQTKWVLWGITFGAAPYIFLHALPPALGLEPVVPIEIARLFSVVIPLAFSFAVIRYKFLDVDIIIRRSLIYPLLASVMVGIYVLLGVLIGRRIVERVPSAEPFVPIVATLVPALLFHPTRRLLAVAIDRLFFKIQYNYAQALAAFRRELRSTDEQSDLAERLREFLDSHLAPKKIGVVLRYGDERYFSGNVDPDLLRRIDREAQVPVVGQARVLAAANITADPKIERPDFLPFAREAGVVLLQPVSAGNRLFGWVALAEKRSERRFIEQDLELLATAAHESAASMQRMNLEQDVLREAVARNRMEEMNRFRTDFFAQVAHDLRSPLTSISWSARNLLDGVVGPLTERQSDYLGGIESSARQLVRLVNNLLELTRLESGAPQVEMAAVPIAEVVAESRSKLAPTGASKSVTLEIAVDDDLPPVRGHREKMLEVIDNLLENAIRYAPPDSAVEVGLHREESGTALEVRDHGPGIAEQDFEKLFEPYRQGKSSPWSTQQGFGLGLYVVRSWVERMGGRIDAANHPKGGALFTLHFAEWSDELPPSLESPPTTSGEDQSGAKA